MSNGSGRIHRWLQRNEPADTVEPDTQLDTLTQIYFAASSANYRRHWRSHCHAPGARQMSPTSVQLRFSSRLRSAFKNCPLRLWAR